MLVGVLGIVVSIVVGFGTYYLAERRGRRNRWQAAKDVVLRDLSKSLGEGNVPSPPVILATIRSVLRTQNAPDLDAVTLEEVADDLLRQITSDPFLASERRTELQNKVLEIRDTHLKPVEVELEATTKESRTPETLSIVSRVEFTSLVAGLLASLVAGLLIVGTPEFFRRIAENLPNLKPYLGAPIIGVLLTVLIATLYRVLLEFRRRK
jgi:hypothetical protein